MTLAGCNLLIHHLAKTSYRARLLEKLDHLPPQADCIFLGNSLVEAGCDVAAFQSGWPATNVAPTAINLALGATSPVEHFLILHRALEQPLRLKYLIYGFFDDQLNDTPRGQWSDLVGNRAFSYYFPDQAAAFYTPGSSLRKWELRVIGHVPMLADRSSLWGKVELLRRRLEDIGLPKRPTNRFGRVADFAALEPKDIASFDERCRAVAEGKAGFSEPVRELIALARQRGAAVILVEMPMPSSHRRRFYSLPAWGQMRAYLQALARQQQALYLSASDWVRDDANFEDATHLNEQGAKLFSQQLAAAVARLSL